MKPKEEQVSSSKGEPTVKEITQATYEIKKYQQLIDDKRTIQNRLNQLAHYIFPRKYNIDNRDTQISGDLPLDVYDGTAIYSLKVLASGLASYLTNPASKWFRLKATNKAKSARTWLYKLEEAVNRLFVQSNFYQSIAELYKTIGGFGSGVVFSEDDKENGKFYQVFDVMNCAFEVDDRNKVIGVYREFFFTSLQCIEGFGTNLPKEIIDDFNNGNGSKRFKILHVVRPRKKYKEGAQDVENKKFSSNYYLFSTKELLGESGFDTFPYKVARFETNPNEPYGYGPAEDALPDIKSLNQAVYDWHEAVQIANRRVIVLPSDSYGAPEDVIMGDIVYKQGGEPNERIDVLGGTNPNITLEMLRDIRNRIQQSFFVDLFFAITNETKRMSIPEVQERIAEKMNILGSALYSLTNEILKPLVEDAIPTVIKLGWVEEAPEDLQELDIQFIGPLARSQRNVDAGAIQNWIQATQNMAVTPELRDALFVINAQNASRDLADILGVPAENIRDKEEVDQILEAEAAAKQQMLQQQQMAQQADMAQKSASAQKDLKA